MPQVFALGGGWDGLPVVREEMWRSEESSKLMVLGESRLLPRLDRRTKAKRA